MVSRDDQHPLQDVHHQPQEDNLYSIVSGADLGKIMYKLEQCNIHWGSEHTVDGNQFMAEMHCVQQRSESDDTSRYGVLGILWLVETDVDQWFHEFVKIVLFSSLLVPCVCCTTKHGHHMCLMSSGFVWFCDALHAMVCTVTVMQSRRMRSEC